MSRADRFALEATVWGWGIVARSWRGMSGARIGRGGRGLLFALLGWGLICGCDPPEQRWAGKRRELVLERLGEAIAQDRPGARVLFVGNPFAHLPGADSALREVDESALRGLRRGLGARASVVGAAVPELRDGVTGDPHGVDLPPGATTPISFLTAAGAWDRMIEGRPVDVLVSVIGVPADLPNTKAWRDPDGPRWALYLPDLRLLGTASDALEAFASGRLIAVILERAGAPPEGKAMLADEKEEFDRRYVLFTRGNVDGLVRDWARWFP